MSRTFALNIPILPASSRDAVCIAYLICRIADTIEDAPTLPSSDRERLFDALLEAVASGGAEPRALDGTAPAEPGYARLMAESPRVFEAFRALPGAQRDAIAACVTEMVAGMRRLAQRPSTGRVRFICDDLAGLDDYCHYVAGTVGLMLTRLFNDEAPGFATPDTAALGRRFGLGLQATNIIKDHADDVARGVCFLPRPYVDFANPDLPMLASQRPTLIGHALGHLDGAMAFTLRLPPAPEGLRLFCLWSLMMALGTLREASEPAGRVPKIGRTEVATIIETSRRLVQDDGALQRWYAAGRADVTDRLRPITA